MLIRFTAEVDGLVVDSAVKEFECNSYTTVLQFDERGLNQVSIERELSDAEISKLDNRIENPQLGNPGVISLGISEEIRREGHETLQTLESLFGLYNVKKLYWRDAAIELIPQSELEKSLDVKKIDLELSKSETPHVWKYDPKDVDWEHIERLKTPLAFFRRGCRFVHNLEYINAYTNFYFIIEGFYSEGDHTNVESTYLESSELMKAAETGFDASMDSLRDGLEPFFEFYGKDRSPEGLIRLYVVIRHQLNHFFHEHSGPHTPSPFDQYDYEPVCLSLMHLTYYILLTKVNDIEIGGSK